MRSEQIVGVFLRNIQFIALFCEVWSMPMKVFLVKQNQIWKNQMWEAFDYNSGPIKRQ